MPEAISREFVGITDQALNALRQRIGLRIGHTLEPWCYEATRDNIRHYAHGIGDDNPLWCDPAYGKTTQYGDIIALPSFLSITSTSTTRRRLSSPVPIPGVFVPIVTWHAKPGPSIRTSSGSRPGCAPGKNSPIFTRFTSTRRGVAKNHATGRMSRWVLHSRRW